MTHTIRLIRLKFIDTADDEQTWSLNVKRQWEAASKMSLRVLAGTKVVGITPPKMIQWYPYTGMSWETECAMGACFPVDFSTESPNVLFEVVGLAKPPGTVLGLVFWSAESFIGSGLHYTRQTLHVFRTGTTQKKSKDRTNVHAVIEVEVQAISPPPSPRRGSVAEGEGGESASSPAGASSSSSTTTKNASSLRKTYRQSHVSPSDLSSNGVNPYRATAIYAANNSGGSNGNTAAASNNAHLTTDMPLSYTFGMVRTSVLDLYFPNQLLSEGTTISATFSPTPAVSSGITIGGHRRLARHSNNDESVGVGVVGIGATTSASSISNTPSPTAAGIGGTSSSSSGSAFSSIAAAGIGSTSAPPKRESTSGNSPVMTLSQPTLGGSIIVSNVICVANLSEKVNLSMQLIARGAGGDETASALIFNPPGGVIVLPNQRAFFSVTWNSDKPLSPHLVEDVQLLLSGPDVSPAPVTFRVHFSDPKNNELYAPYHYWANGTLITNRPLNTHRELPFIRSVLPVFMLQDGILGVGAGGSDKNGAGPRVVGAEYSTFADDDEDGGLWVRDADTGLHRRVVSSGAVGPSLLPESLRLFSDTKHRKNGSALSNNNSTAGNPMKLYSIKSWRNEYARCTLRLGTLIGFPMMTSSSTREGMAPSFKIMAQLLETGNGRGNLHPDNAVNNDAVFNGIPLPTSAMGPYGSGWTFENGAEDETQEVYQTLSGSLRWNPEDNIILHKRPNATLAQFLRLTLIECSAMDRDETPIAAAIVSLPTDTASSLQPVNLCIAFYVFDTFSLFDQLPTSSLVMKNASMKFARMNVVADDIATAAKNKSSPSRK